MSSSLTAPDIREVPVSIYVLTEPGDGIPRYVGRSERPERRLIGHVANGTPAVAAWVSSLKAKGLRPVLRVLEIVGPGVDSAKREASTIAFYRKHGAELLNVHGVDELRPARPRLVAATNRGAEAFAALGMSQVHLAKVIGAPQSSICSWLSGKTTPSPKHRAVIEDELSIYWRLWDEAVR